MATQIRILHMIGTLGIGGSQAFVMALYRKLDRDKIQFDFIVDSPQLVHFVPEIESLGGRVYYFPKFDGRNFYEVRRFWDSFLDEHTEYKVLHSHVRSYASVYLPIAKAHGLTTIIHSHSNSNGKGLKAMGKTILQFPLRFQADYFFACSKEAGEWLFGKRVCHSKSFYIVKNAIEADSFAFSVQERRTIRNELSIGNEFVLGFLARVTEAKNPFFVIDVMEELLQIAPNSKLLFVGDGDVLDRVKEYSIVKGIQDHIIFTGERSDVSRLLSAMDYYILPSKWEGFGISLIEAQTSGLQCICSDGIPEAAIVTDLVCRRSLHEGARAWAKTIAKAIDNRVRPNNANRIKEVGLDVAENSRWLYDFYVEIFKRNE